jgi:Homocysteine/selenocysteine methylase (S-methylmethionine-dependent)
MDEHEQLYWKGRKVRASLSRGIDWSTRVIAMPQPECGEWENPWADRGVRIIGGCCGIGPEHIGALSQRLRGQGGSAAPTGVPSDLA